MRSLAIKVFIAVFLGIVLVSGAQAYYVAAPEYLVGQNVTCMVFRDGVCWDSDAQSSIIYMPADDTLSIDFAIYYLTGGSAGNPVFDDDSWNDPDPYPDLITSQWIFTKAGGTPELYTVDSRYPSYSRLFSAADAGIWTVEYDFRDDPVAESPTNDSPTTAPDPGWDYSGSFTLVVDTSAPEVTVVSDDGVYTNSLTSLHCSWAAEDSESGLCAYEYKISDNLGNTVRDWTSVSDTTIEVTADMLNLVESRTYYFHVKACNRAGMWSSEGVSDGITVDWTEPLIDSATLAPTITQQNFTITYSASDTGGSGVSKIKLWQNVNGEYQYTDTDLGSSPYQMQWSAGAYDFAITAVDSAGNESALAILPQVTVDETPPSMPSVADDGETIAYPTSPVTTESLHASWASQDSESGVSLYEYRIIEVNGKQESVIYGPATTSDSEVTVPNLALVPGRAYYFGVKAENGAGLWSDEAWSDRITCKQIVYVDRSAGGTPDGTTWQRAYHDIATALANATAGKEIWVAKGTFFENITLRSQIGLYGSFAGGESIRTAARDWTGNLTVIDGANLGPVVVVPQNVLTPTVIDGFTIQHGQAAQYYTYNRGGGIFCDQGGDAWITNNVIKNNKANAYGGGIACYMASPWIAYNTITTNEVANWDGGGIHCYGGCPWIFQNEISYNKAGFGRYGAGIATAGGSPTIEGNLISGNCRFGSGGGIYCASGSYWILDNEIKDNTNPLPDTSWPAGDGGGICCNVGTDVLISGNVITGNEIAGGSGYYGGAGIYLNHCWGIASNNTLASNCFRKSGYNGGGAYIKDCTSLFEFVNNTVLNNSTLLSSGTGGGGGGIYCSGGDPLIACNAVSGNTGYSGGGISIVNTNATVECNLVEENTSASYGGGVVVSGSTYNPIIHNNIVRDNATTGTGAGLYLGYGTILVTNNTITGNTASGNGGGVYCAYAPSYATIVNCIVYGNSSGIYANQCTPVHHHNCVTFNSGGDYSINLSRGTTDLPEQTDPALSADGIHLTQGSACVDVGDDTLAPSYDCDGDSRPQDGDSVPGAVCDIGADELVP